MKKIILVLFFLLGSFCLWAQVVDQAWAKANYTKREVMIPMRDGVFLYTAIYEPKTLQMPSPILMLRTPYRCVPYGPSMNNTLWTQWYLYAREKYTFVFQDVRGTGNSKGVFDNIRPIGSVNEKKQRIDEATDTYDAVDWLIKNIKNTNGNVAIIGSSYPGFYAMMGGLSGHPAIKAVVPEAPVTDWFMGDDLHHNGALMLTDAFRFLTNFDRVNYPGQNPLRAYKPYNSSDEYSFFLHLGALKNISHLIQDSVRFWHQMLDHPTYDYWWQERNVRRACNNIRPAVLIVGGLFDAEDCFGAWELYKAIRKQSPSTPLSLVVGPWWHGAWNKPRVDAFGNISFGSNTAAYYRENIEFPFIQGYVKPGWSIRPAQVNCFVTGENAWRTYPHWPPAQSEPCSLYLQANAKASFQEPKPLNSSTTYISDPANPVPYTLKIGRSRSKEYMIEDQSFVQSRSDVLCFTTDVLENNVTVVGSPQIELFVSSSTTDADFIVKIIDEFPQVGAPDGIYYSLNGYQMLIRGDVMRARFRNSFEHPEALVANQMTKVSFVMTDISHVFKKGHRIQIQVQSSWFPLVDRNPQKFVNIASCEDADFIPATIKIFHQADAASRIILPNIDTKPNRD